MNDWDNTHRDKLIKLLEDDDLRDDIGVANHLVETYAESADLPGDLLNWAARFDIDEMVDAMKQMKGLHEEYDFMVKPSHSSQLEENWAGAGAIAFMGVWEDLQHHVGPEVLGKYLKEFTDDLDKLIGNAVKFQEDCVASAEMLRGLREEYCKALVASAAEGEESMQDSVISGAGLGATFGSAGGVPGAIIGSLLGALYGLAEGFGDQEDISKEKEQAKVDSASELGKEQKERVESFDGVIGKDSAYTSGDDSYTKWDPKDVDDEWDEEWAPA